METQTLPAEVRIARGKGPARQLRMKGKIPAVLYGPGGEALVLTVDPIALTKALTTPFRRNQLMELEIDGKKQFATVKDLDIHPVTRDIRHADFYRVSLDTPAEYQIPLRTVGRAKGVVKGGELRVHFRTLPIKVAPDKVPAEIVLNVENLDMNESIRVKDIKLEHGELQLPAERAVVFLSSEVRKIAEEEPVAGAAAAAPAATAPAAAAKAPAKAPSKK
jgi:large subunit ribosomal protein L25